MAETDIRIRFRRDLAALQEEVLRLGSMVDTAIRKAMHALKYRDLNLAREVIANDAEINDLRFSIEDHCYKLIAKQQPMAGDLRIIIAVMSVVLDIERMGDHAAGVANIALQIGDKPPLKPLVDLPRMADICRDMLRQSLEALVNKDNDLAQATIKRDDQVDALYTQIFREMLTFMTDDPETVTRGMCLLFVGHNLERIADRVTNICERVLFVTTGRMEEIPSGETNISLEEE